MNTKLLRCAITDRTYFSRNGQEFDALLDPPIALLRQAERLAAEGVDFLQLREKDLGAAELAFLARNLLHALRSSATKLLLNARADIAVAVAAHGVHLTSSPGELTPQQVHDLYAHAGLPAPVVTVACHSLEEIARRRLEPVTAILFGPVFEKVVSGKKTNMDGTGLALLHQACLAAAPVPVLALGGITPDLIPACLQAGAGGVAGIRLFQDV